MAASPLPPRTHSLLLSPPPSTPHPLPPPLPHSQEWKKLADATRMDAASSSCSAAREGVGFSAAVGGALQVSWGPSRRAPPPKRAMIEKGSRVPSRAKEPRQRSKEPHFLPAKEP